MEPARLPCLSIGWLEDGSQLATNRCLHLGEPVAVGRVPVPDHLQDVHWRYIISKLAKC